MDLVSDLHLDLIPFSSGHQSREEQAQTRATQLPQWLMEYVFQHSSKRGDTLLVAGDIASLHTETGRQCWQLFVDTAKNRCGYAYILVVFGNHEHYGGDLQDTDQIFFELFSRPLPSTSQQEAGCLKDTADSIVLLHTHATTSSATLPTPKPRLVSWTHPTLGIRVAGCTLWSDIPRQAEEVVASRMNDYKFIQYRKQKLCVADTNRFFREQRQALEHLIAVNPPDIIMTHHAPLLHAGCSPDKYNPSSFLGNHMPQDARYMTHAFESDLEELVLCTYVWCFGHTHQNTKMQVGECCLMSNARGYSDDYEEYKNYHGVMPLPLEAILKDKQN